MSDFDNRLVPNYIFAGATIAVFLFAAIFVLLNAQDLIVQIPDNPEQALILGGVGGAIITALIVVTKDVYTYFFRKNPE